MSEFNPYTPPEALRKNAEKNDALPEELPTLDEASGRRANLSYRQHVEAFPAKESSAADSGQPSAQSDMSNTTQQANDATGSKGQSDNTAANQQSQSDAQNTVANLSDTSTKADREALRNVRLELVRIQLQEQGQLNQSLRPE